MKNLFDLQLFAEDEVEVDDEGYQGEEETDDVGVEDELDLDEETDEEESEEDETDETEEDDEQLDKKTKAIIRYKKEAKEAKEKLAEIERQQQEAKDQKEKDKLIDKKIEAGYSEDEAKRMTELEFENKKLKREVIDNRFAKLESKYPLISNYKDEILEKQKDLPGASLEEVYLAKFFSGSQKDAEKLAKQRMLYAKEEANNKQQESGQSKNMSKDNTKLSPSDERAFKILKETRSDMTRSRFKELLDSDEIE